MTGNYKVRNEHNEVRLGIFAFSLTVLGILCLMSLFQ
jgi:hypothetical protein